MTEAQKSVTNFIKTYVCDTCETGEMIAELTGHNHVCNNPGCEAELEIPGRRYPEYFEQIQGQNAKLIRRRWLQE